MNGLPGVIHALNRTTRIVAQRDRQHGDAIDQHRRLAKLWSVYLGVPIRDTDAAVMLMLLKVSRIAESAATGPYPTIATSTFGGIGFHGDLFC